MTETDSPRTWTRRQAMQTLGAMGLGVLAP
jgi:hypothetical protein